MSTTNPSEVPRNDPHAALTVFIRLHRSNGGKVPEEQARILIRMQDDPDEYLRLVDAFLAGQTGT